MFESERRSCQNNHSMQDAPRNNSWDVKEFGFLFLTSSQFSSPNIFPKATCNLFQCDQSPEVAVLPLRNAQCYQPIVCSHGILKQWYSNLFSVCISPHVSSLQLCTPSKLLVYNSSYTQSIIYTLLTYSVAVVRKRTIPTERPPIVGEASANFCG
jgi:hypothetical protein